MSEKTCFAVTLLKIRNLTNAILRMKAHQHVYVILVIPELFNFQVIPLFNAFHGVAHSGDNLRSQQRLSVLQWEDEVVMGVVSAVILLVTGTLLV